MGSGIIVSRHIAANAIKTAALGNSSDLQIPAVNLAGLRIKSQADTTNATPTTAIIQTGWGQILGTSSASISESVTFPQAFTELLSLTVSFLGYKSGGAAAANITEFNSAVGAGSDMLEAYGPSTTGFSVRGSATGGAFGPAYHGYSWIAVGKI